MNAVERAAEVTPGDSVCCFAWRASRVEAATTDVTHICNKPTGHPSTERPPGAKHQCSCGAVKEMSR